MVFLLCNSVISDRLIKLTSTLNQYSDMLVFLLMFVCAFKLVVSLSQRSR